LIGAAIDVEFGDVEFGNVELSAMTDWPKDIYDVLKEAGIA